MPENNIEHDLLIEVSVKLDRVISDVKELKDNVVSDVENLKLNKADKIDTDARLKTQEAFRWKIIGINAAITFIITVIGVVAAIMTIKN